MELLERIKKRLGFKPNFEEFSKNELLEELPEHLTLEQSISILLMLEGEKPGVLIMGANETQRKLVEVFCKKFDHEYLAREGVRKPGLFITKDPDRFQIIKDSEGSFYNASESAVGEFLGYEEKARKHYKETNQENEPIRKKYQEKLEELEEKNELPQEHRKYLKLIQYIPYPDEKHIVEAITRGKNRYKMLKKNPIGRKFLQKLEKETQDKEHVKKEF